MRVLVTYGSKRSGTSELAGWVADGLREASVDVEVVPCPEVTTLAGYDGVVIGGSLYASRWHEDARRFVREHSLALEQRPVWLFSSGPLDPRAAEEDLPPVHDVERAMEHVRARGHRTFGGRLEPDPKGFVAKRVARERAGDWRDPEAAREWGLAIAEALKLEPQAT
jgi:menaquinone-dependent protoporphyrinogen oxidase